MDFLSYAIPTTIYLFGFSLELAYTRIDANKLKERRIFSIRANIALGLLLFLIAALRSPGTGMDTGQYHAMFRNILYDDMPLSYYREIVVTAIKDGTFKDNMFWDFFMRFCAYLIRDAQLWLAFVSFIYLFATYLIINKYSEDPVASWLYIYFVFIFTFILQGLRQSVAMALVMLSFRCIMEKQPRKFLLLNAVAWLFHQSSVVFLIAYPLSKIKITRGYFMAALAFGVMCQAIPSVILGMMGQFVANTRFSSYTAQISGLSWSSFAIQAAIFLFCYFFGKKKEDELQSVLLNLSVMGIIVQSLAVIVSEAFRISYYFNMFNMLLLANTIDSIEDEKYSQYYRIGVITLLFAYGLIAGAFKYRFYWQG